jgi:biphenyl-2,3-diol 1,2-dioxygenase
MASVTQLGYLGASVSDLAAWETFATEVLGMQVSERGNDGTLLLRMDEQHYRIALHPGTDDDVAYLGWRVTDDEALVEITDRLKAAGVAVTPGSPEETAARKVQGLMKLRDPSGIATEIFYGPQCDYDKPFRSPRGVSFVTGDQGLGHAVLRVDDRDASLSFYRTLLGFRISDYIEIQRPGGRPAMGMVFLHCNPRHHSLALMQMPPTPQKRLWHWMLQTQSIDDVGTTYYLCEDRGLLATTLGRHTNDHMVSFYITTPSGFEIEYGWGAREVDDATWQVQRHVSGTMWGHRRVPAPASAPASAPAGTRG